jgi:hypothetical protein
MYKFISFIFCLGLIVFISICSMIFGYLLYKIRMLIGTKSNSKNINRYLKRRR